MKDKKISALLKSLEFPFLFYFSFSFLQLAIVPVLLNKSARQYLFLITAVIFLIFIYSSMHSSNNLSESTTFSGSSLLSEVEGNCLMTADFPY
jgi:hypothetical protein